MNHEEMYKFLAQLQMEIYKLSRIEDSNDRRNKAEELYDMIETTKEEL